MKSSKANRYTFLTGLLLCTLIWSGVGSFITTLRDSAERDAHREALLNARLFAEQATNVIRSIEATVNFTAYELAQDPAPNRIETLVRQGVIPMDMLVLLTFVDAKGGTVGSSLGPDTARTDLSDREHIRVHLERSVDGLFVGKPVLGRVSGKWSIQLTKRVTGPDGSLVGIVVASLDPFYFQRFWQDVTMAGTLIEMAGLDGVLRTRSQDIDLSLKTQIDRSKLAGRAREGKSGLFIDTGSDGVERLSAFERLDGLPLVVMTGNSRNAVLAGVQPTVNRYLALGGAATLIILAFGFSFSRMTSRLERKEQEETAARQRLLGAVESVADGFMLFDAQDRLILANSSQKALYPEAADSLVSGRTYEDIVRAGVAEGALRPPPEESEEDFVRKMMAAHRNPGQPFEVRVSNDRWVRIAERRTETGETVGVRIDITPLKQREAELKRLAVAAQQASEAKSAFIAAMSHEIRTPLNAVVGFSALMMKSRLDEEQKSYAHTIDASAKHLLGIINDILDFAQIESGRVNLHNADFSFSEAFASLEGALRALIGERDIAVAVDIAPALHDHAHGDAMRLYQVLLNLGGNAVKFTEHGRIRIRIAPAPQARVPNLVRFEIQDTGKGIPAEAHQRIFDAFEQAGSDDVIRHDGAGLGLAISQRLVRCMGGEIRLESTPGKGSRFWFDIVLPPAKSQAGLREPERAFLGKPLNIIIADDAPSSRLLLSVLLRKQGHRVTEARNGAEAVRHVREGACDLVLMDLEMPVMGGLDATRAIRALEGPARATPIVALTAQVFEKDRRSALEAGMNGFLPKPFTEKGLAEILSGLSHDQAQAS